MCALQGLALLCSNLSRSWVDGRFEMIGVLGDRGSEGLLR